MIADLAGMLLLGFMIGLTGALAPGPTLVATINASVKGGWSMGPRVAFGHILTEVGMVLLIVTGIYSLVGAWSSLIFIIGGVALVLFGILTLVESRTAGITFSDSQAKVRGPVLAGIVTSISNPYFWIWWFTVGSALLISAFEGGAFMVIAFITGHWAADLGWLTLVSSGIHRGRFILNEKWYRRVLAACGLLLIAFGLIFIALA